MHEKQRVIRLRHFIVLAVVCTMCIGSARSFYGIYRKRDFVEERETVLETLKNETIELEKQLEYSQTPQFIEREARDKLGYGRPGETVVLVEPTATGSVKNSPEAKVLPTWKQWWALFF